MDRERRGILEGLSPGAMLIGTGLATLAIGFVFQLIAMLIAVPVFNVSIFELGNFSGELSTNVLSALKFVQIIGALGTFVFAGFLLSFLYTGSWTGFFTFNIIPEGRAVILLILIMIISLPFVNFLTELNQKFVLPFERVENYLRTMEENTGNLMMQLLKAENVFGLLVNIFMIAIIPAVGEELIFRGLLQKHFTDITKTPHLAIILTAAVFSIIHMQFYSFLPRFYLGLLLGYFFYYGKSIWYPIIAHLVNNGMGVVFYYYYMKDVATESLEEIGTTEMLPLVALLSIIAAGGLTYFWITFVKPNQSPRVD